MKEFQKKKFGDLKNPLLVSIRSGARVSMPGMMDTILNLGLNDKTVLALQNKTLKPIPHFLESYAGIILKETNWS